MASRIELLNKQPPGTRQPRHTRLRSQGLRLGKSRSRIYPWAAMSTWEIPEDRSSRGMPEFGTRFMKSPTRPFCDLGWRRRRGREPTPNNFLCAAHEYPSKDNAHRIAAHFATGFDH